VSKQEAIEYVASHNDDDELSLEDLREVFEALYDREPDETDEEQGLWSHCCCELD
jgi:hypothetical protein